MPDAHDQIDGCPLLLVGGDGDLDAVATERRASLPAVIAAIDAEGEPEWADLVLATDDERAEVAATIDIAPMASVALAMLLRGGAVRGVGDGLVAESAVYSTLQAGPEFAAWRASRPVKDRRPSEVRVTRVGDTLRIVLDRPDVHNALDTAMRDALVDALQLAAFDDTITAVELSGDGPSFCAGGDLDEFGTRADPASAHNVRVRRSVGRLMAELADRTTVHIHGATMGSGIELAAFAGRVVAHHGTRIALPEVRLGLIPGAGGTVSLPRRIGRHRTALLALTCLPIDANTALEWGLVDALSE